MSGYPYSLWALYALTYMAQAILGTFVPVYFHSIGLDSGRIGQLLALGPLMAVFANPFWGIAGDRAANKNRILAILVLGSSVTMLAFPHSVNYAVLMGILAVFTFFQSSIFPLSDAVTLEYLEESRWKFGPIRMAGTLGFSVMSLVGGAFARWNLESIFVLYPCIGIFTLITIYRMPVIKGHQACGNRISPWQLLKNRDVMVLIFFNFFIQLTYGFYQSFFPIYYNQLGADNTMLGLSMLIAAASEIPFLLLAGPILEKLGIRLTLMISAVITSLRWALTYLVTDTGAILAVGITHGFSFIVFSFCVATFINKNVPKELRASGQTMNALLCMGLARAAGSAFGGVLSSFTGIRQVFLWNSWVGFLSVLVFGMILFRQKNPMKELE